jgi:hypothetical protein
LQDPEQKARASLFRSMIIYAVLLLADVAVLYYIAANAVSGFAFFTFSVVGVVGLLLAWQVFQHYMDMRAPLAESEGVVLKKWNGRTSSSPGTASMCW